MLHMNNYMWGCLLFAATYEAMVLQTAFIARLWIYSSTVVGLDHNRSWVYSLSMVVGLDQRFY